jgi:ShET2 enterotoxin, N-terminal region
LLHVNRPVEPAAPVNVAAMFKFRSFQQVAKPNPFGQLLEQRGPPSLLLQRIQGSLPPNHVSTLARSPSFRPSWACVVNSGEVRTVATFSSSEARAAAHRVAQIAAKSTPYVSKSSVPAELNMEVCAASFPGGPDEPVACRHLAYWFAQYPDKKNTLLKQFASREGIKAVFDGKLHEVHLESLRKVRTASQDAKHLVCADELGDYLTSLATSLTAMQVQKPWVTEVNCLLLTSDHSMALHLQHKRKNGITYFAAKLYDPNDTASYRRVVALTPEGFGPLRFETLLVSPENASCYAAQECMPMTLAAVCLGDARPAMKRSATASAASMHMALRCGVLEEVRAALRTARSLGNSLGEASSQRVFELVQARSGVHQLPGLYYALQDGHAEAVGEFVDGILGLESLSDDQRVLLLSADRWDGVGGLYMALYEGQTEAVQRFLEPVLRSNLSEAAKVILAQATHANGVPGVLAASLNGQAETVQVFTELVGESSLPEEVKDQLTKPVQAESC